MRALALLCLVACTAPLRPEPVDVAAEVRATAALVLLRPPCELPPLYDVPEVVGFSAPSTIYVTKDDVAQLWAAYQYLVRRERAREECEARR